jgi:hypothetical protein
VIGEPTQQQLLLSLHSLLKTGIHSLTRFPHSTVSKGSALKKTSTGVSPFITVKVVNIGVKLETNTPCVCPLFKTKSKNGLITQQKYLSSK